MTTALPQGGLPVERLCALAGVSRAGYYRHWQASAPRREEAAVRDAIQRVALAIAITVTGGSPHSSAARGWRSIASGCCG